MDWSAVCDAYGPATDTPALLRAFASDNLTHREFATELLFQTVWHQGNVYSASAAAVPFLYNLLEADGPHDKPDVASLIVTISQGQPPFVHCDNDPKEAAFWGDILRKAGRSLEAEIAEGRVIAAEVQRQVARRADLLQPYLTTGEPPTVVGWASESRMQGDRYEVILGSDSARGGMYLELWDGPTGRLALWAFYADADGSFEFTRYRDDVPPEVEAWFRQEARRRLPPVVEAGPDAAAPDGRGE